MTFNNRIYQYTCSVCKRNIEKLADPTRPDPVRCLITNKCTGILSLSRSRLGTRVKTTPTVVGLQDRIPRGTVISNPTLAKTTEKITVSTFPNSNGLAIAAVKLAGISSTIFTLKDITGTTRVIDRKAQSNFATTSSRIIATLYEVLPASLNYTKYIYTLTGSVSIVNGRDNSAQQILLSFDTSSNIKVYINGRLLTASEFNRSVLGSISFPIPFEASILTVEVFIYKSIAQNSQTIPIVLNFNALPYNNPQRVGGAWGNAAVVSGYVPLYCTDLSKLSASKVYVLSKLESYDEANIKFQIQSASVYILLANAPYAFQDKMLSNVILGSSLTDYNYFLDFGIDPESGITSLRVSTEAISALTRSLVVTKTLDIESNVINSVRNSKTKVIKSYIIGPS